MPARGTCRKHVCHRPYVSQNPLHGNQPLIHASPVLTMIGNHARVCVCACACVHVCIYACVRTCMCMCMCCTCACACVCLYVCIRTYSTWTIKNDFCDEFGESEPIFKSHEIRMSLEHFGCEGLSIGFGRRCRPHACMAATKGCH
jgi:hypothetical protein